MQDLDIDDKKKSSPGAHVTEKGVDVEDHKRQCVPFLAHHALLRAPG